MLWCFVLEPRNLYLVVLEPIDSCDGYGGGGWNHGAKVVASIVNKDDDDNFLIIILVIVSLIKNKII